MLIAMLLLPVGLVGGTLSRLSSGGHDRCRVAGMGAQGARGSTSGGADAVWDLIMDAEALARGERSLLPRDVVEAMIIETRLK